MKTEHDALDFHGKEAAVAFGGLCWAWEIGYDRAAAPAALLAKFKMGDGSMRESVAIATGENARADDGLLRSLQEMAP